MIRSISTGILLCTFLMFPALAADPSAAAGWDRIGQMAKNQKVKVHLRDGNILAGIIQEFGTDGFTLAGKGKANALKRADIERLTKKARAKSAMWGAVAGFGLGAGLGAAAAGKITDKNNPSASDRMGSAVGVGAFLSGIGAVIGVAGGYDQTIYKADR